MLEEIETICNSYTGKAQHLKLLELFTKKMQDNSANEKFAGMIEDLKKTYQNRLWRKTGWGSKELMSEFNEAVITVISRMVK